MNTEAPSLTNAKERALKQALHKDAVFQKEYERLNADQKQAVDTIDGPVMVVAGPGTGKTQVLALRVAKILKTTQMRPSNILCLTFSKSGATAMRNRLRSIIGSDAYGVTVHTIHGFCNDIITSHPNVFADWSSLSQISDVERFRMLNKIIDQNIIGSSLLNPKSPYIRTKDILDRIAQLKREGVTTKDQLEKAADEYDEHMRTKSKEGTKAHERNLLSAKKFREFIHLFLSYQDKLKRSGRYDYEDMIVHVIEALKQEDWLLSSLQERYQYILVDEFQDTNGAQYQLIDTLTRDPTADSSPNLFVVGDDDQAIYRFQGANLQNILSFRSTYPSAPVIALTTSYRCTQNILDAAQLLIEHNTERLVGKIDGLDKHLKASTNESGTNPTMYFAASDTAEPWMIADIVSQRIEQGIDPEDICVLVQTNRELLPLYEVFQAREIEVELSGKLDLLSHPLVMQVLSILRAIQNPHDSTLLSAALSAACFGCHPADLSVLYTARRDQKASLLDVCLSLEEQSLNLRNRDTLIAARDTILSLYHQLPNRTVLQTLEDVYTECGLLKDAGTSKMEIVDFAALQEFFERIKQRAYEQPEFSFEMFLDDIEYYANPDYASLRLTYDLPHITQSGVKLMTAHQSKGLEFHTVILANMREGHWDKRRVPASVSIPEDILFGWEKDQKDFEKNQDERRVAFVSITRAKRELIFTCPSAISSGDSLKDVSPSIFFAECGELDECQREIEDPESMSTLLAPVSRSFDTEFAAYLHKKIENFALSPTSLNTFLEDPKRFLEEELLQKPKAKSIHFAYGNAIHHIVAKWADSVVSGENLDQSALLEEFTTHLTVDELLTEAERNRLIDIGVKSIEQYYQHMLQPPYPIVHKVEFAIKTHLGDIPIKGKIDRIDLMEPNSSFAIVTDFKTGKPKTEKQSIDYGYKRQLVFYDLLIRNGYSMIEPKEFRLEFIGEREDGPVTRKFAIEESDRKELKETIEAVWSKIVALDFTHL